MRAGLDSARGPGLGIYALSLVLSLGPAAGFGWHLVLAFRSGVATGLASERPARRGQVLGVGLLLAVAAVGVVFGYVDRSSVTTEVSVTASKQSDVLREMTEELDGHPDRPRSQLVSQGQLVSEGVSACEWLADQPGGDEAVGFDEARTAYFRANPDVFSQPALERGPTSLRWGLLVNAWGVLCPEVYADHVSFRVAQEGD